MKERDAIVRLERENGGQAHNPTTYDQHIAP